MRRTILLSSILLLSAVWAAAQVDSNSDSEQTISTRLTVEGCLEGAIGNYTVTDFAGASYQLTGDTEQLKSHVGDTVRVTGEFTPVVHIPYTTSEGTQTEPTLSVTSFRRISGVCSDAIGIP